MKFLLAGLVVALAVAVVSAAPLASPVKAFLTIGDWGCPDASDVRVMAKKPQLQHTPTEEEHQIEIMVAAQTSNYSTTQGFEKDVGFILALGDNFYDSGVSSVDDDQWQSTFEQVFTAPVHQNRWYVIAGNHDYKGNVTAQIEYTKQSSRWYFPAKRYTEVFSVPGNKTMVMIFIYTGSYNGDGVPASETKYVSEQLNKHAATADYLFVVGHHPVVSVGEHGPTHAMDSDFKLLLEKYQVTAYLGGHDHILQYLVDNDISYFGSGGGCKLQGTVTPSKVFPTTTLKFAKVLNGFMAHRFSPDGSHQNVTLVDCTGTEVYGTTLFPREKTPFVAREP